LTAPLVTLLKNNAKWNWDEKQRKAVCALVRLLSEEPVLVHFDESLPTEIHTDVSHFGLGAVLAQKVDGEVKPVAFLSRALSDAESRYHLNELKCLALVWALKKFRCYVYGRPFYRPYRQLRSKMVVGQERVVGKIFKVNFEHSRI
jgi:hypothetical protein